MISTLATNRTRSFATNKSPSTLDPKFYANADNQAAAPQAFALQGEALAALRQMDSAEAEAALVSAVHADPELSSAVKGFDKMSWEQKEPVLRKFFSTECQTLGMQPPQLLIQDNAIPGPAFFDFNVQAPDPGKVILNPVALAKEKDGFAPLLLLAHETRHSKQFQMAFGLAPCERPEAAEGYKAAFIAQKELTQDPNHKLSFVDFCSLLNEFEAFQFANKVVGQLTDGKADTSTMGTLASQFDDQGHKKIDLVQLFEQVGPSHVLDTFNQLEKPQYDAMHPPAKTATGARLAASH